MRKWVILLIMLVSLAGCGYKAQLEQKVQVDSVMDGTYRIETCVWIITWEGRPKSLEFLEWEVVHAGDIQRVKSCQYEAALPKYLQVKQFLKDNPDMRFQ